MFGRLFHYSFDLLAVSTVIAGIKKNTGFAVQTPQITDPTIRSIADSYLSIGDTIFSAASGMAVNSGYFGRGVVSGKDAKVVAP